MGVDKKKTSPAKSHNTPPKNIKTPKRGKTPTDSIKSTNTIKGKININSKKTVKAIHYSGIDESTCENEVKKYQFELPLDDSFTKKNLIIPIDDNTFKLILNTKYQTHKYLDNNNKFAGIYTILETMGLSILPVFTHKESSLMEAIHKPEDDTYIFGSDSDLFICFKNMLPDSFYNSEKLNKSLINKDYVLLFVFNFYTFMPHIDDIHKHLIKLIPQSSISSLHSKGGKSGNKRTNKREHKTRRTRKTRK
jgi:hypothetical protein